MQALGLSQMQGPPGTVPLRDAGREDRQNAPAIDLVTVAQPFQDSGHAPPQEPETPPQPPAQQPTTADSSEVPDHGSACLAQGSGSWAARHRGGTTDLGPYGRRHRFADAGCGVVVAGGPRPGKPAAAAPQQVGLLLDQIWTFRGGRTRITSER